MKLNDPKTTFYFVWFDCIHSRQQKKKDISSTCCFSQKKGIWNKGSWFFRKDGIWWKYKLISCATNYWSCDKPNSGVDTQDIAPVQPLCFSFYNEYSILISIYCSPDCMKCISCAYFFTLLVALVDSEGGWGGTGVPMFEKKKTDHTHLHRCLYGR